MTPDPLIGSDGLSTPQTFDARTWATDFVRHTNKNPSIAHDEGTMITWFANAIMAGYDHAHREIARRDNRPLKRKTNKQKRADLQKAIKALL